MAAPLIAMLTDFGSADAYVGTLKGVILSRCPAARLVDLGHQAGGDSEVVVLLSETTVRAAGAGAIVEDLGDQRMRGRFRAERVYRL